jgi:hypothetical protein
MLAVHCDCRRSTLFVIDEVRPMRHSTGKLLNEAPHTETDNVFGAGNNGADEYDRRQPIDDPDEASELDEIDPDDARWDAFIADDDERDPQPEYGDFWPAD